MLYEGVSEADRVVRPRVRCTRGSFGTVEYVMTWSFS